MKNKKILIISVLAILSLVLITIGATVAFFSYIGEGSTDNTIESGNISFIYEEVDKMGSGISIIDALPVSDSDGKVNNSYFDFKVKSTTTSNVTIPYEITTRVVDGSDDLSDYVKLYLTKVNGVNEQQVALSIYSDLLDSTNTLAVPYGDKTLYKDTIPESSTDYVENYRLRMWLNDNPNDGSVLDYSPVYVCSDTQYTNQTDCESNNGVWNPTENYNNQNKRFSITVNIYANGKEVSKNTNSDNLLRNMILADNPDTKDIVIPSEELTFKTSEESSEQYRSGLFKTTDYNGGDTYYYRGNVTNNYLKIGDDIWRIVRVNEDGTVRIISQGYINYNNDDTFVFNDKSNKTILDLYYTNGTSEGTDYDLFYIANSWFRDNIENNDNYKNIVTTGTYCQAFEAVYGTEYDGNANAQMFTQYVPSFNCPMEDGNITNGRVDLNVGLITIDELLMAGGTFFKTNSNYYLSILSGWWTMGPSQYQYNPQVWDVYSDGSARPIYVGSVNERFRPVINLKANTTATRQVIDGITYYVVD